MYGEVFTTDGRIRSMNLVVMADNAAPVINTMTQEKWPAIATVLDPVTAKLEK